MSQVTQRHAEELAQGAQTLGVALSPLQQEQLLAYLALLIKWNKAYNLTAVRNPDEMVSRHLLDSLSVVPFVRAAGDNWLDVGSGGGMPGIPLAILFPEVAFHLIDSIGKKIKAVQDMAHALHLTNLTAEQTRAAVEVEAMPEEAVLVRMMSDYAVLRDQARACR